MKWQGREGSSNIEDRRGAGGGFGGGGLGGGFPGGGLSGGGIPIPIGGRGGFGGIVGIVVLLGICWALGINPLSQTFFYKVFKSASAVPVLWDADKYHGGSVPFNWLFADGHVDQFLSSAN